MEAWRLQLHLDPARTLHKTFRSRLFCRAASLRVSICPVEVDP